MEEVEKLLARFAPVRLDSTGRAGLSESDEKCLKKLLEAGQLMDKLWAQQMWSGGERFFSLVQEHLEPSSALFRYVMINKGPWSYLDQGKCFVPTNEAIPMDIPEFPPKGANFYPEDVTKEELNSWIESLPLLEQEKARGYFHVVRRTSSGALQNIPYSEEFHETLSCASRLLLEAAEETKEESLKAFLTARAHSFLSNDYYESERLWMTCDSVLDITIGPYEVYQDHLFASKASFEVFIAIRDDVETAKLGMFQSMMQELEDNLPLNPEFKNPNVKMNTPIKVVQLIYSAGDVGGCQTIAFCLPNDERVVRESGSKLILLKNVSAAKHDLIMEPIARECVVAAQVPLVLFDAFFTHTLCHECCHSIGPHDLPSRGTVRQALEEFHSALEEAKADIVGLWALQYLMDKGMVPVELRESVYVSFMVGAIRSIRFGLDEAHGKGLATQFNYLLQRGSFYFDTDQRKFAVDFSAIKEHVSELARIILTIQAEGNKSKAQSLFEEYAVIPPSLQECLDRMEHIPVDIVPQYTALESLSTPNASQE